MLGGTPITITIDSQCSKEITGTLQCVFNGTEVAPAFALTTNENQFLCSTPMFDRTGRIPFELRAQVKTNRTLSLFDTFYLGEYFICGHISTVIIVLPVSNI